MIDKFKKLFNKNTDDTAVEILEEIIAEVNNSSDISVSINKKSKVIALLNATKGDRVNLSEVARTAKCSREYVRLIANEIGFTGRWNNIPRKCSMCEIHKEPREFLHKDHEECAKCRRELAVIRKSMWSPRYGLMECVDCKSDDRVHAGNGRCSLCYQKHRYKTTPAYRDCKINTTKKWQKANPKRHREYISSYNKNKYANDPEYRKRTLDKSRKWQAANKDKVNASVRERRARAKARAKRLTLSDFTIKTNLEVHYIEWAELEKKLPDYQGFLSWMSGQTSIMAGAYPCDVNRYLKGLPIID